MSKLIHNKTWFYGSNKVCMIYMCVSAFVSLTRLFVMNGTKLCLFIARNNSNSNYTLQKSAVMQHFHKKKNNLFHFTHTLKKTQVYKSFKSIFTQNIYIIKMSIFLQPDTINFKCVLLANTCIWDKGEDIDKQKGGNILICFNASLVKSNRDSRKKSIMPPVSVQK